MKKTSKNSLPRVMPLADRVLIKEIDISDTKTSSGIIVPKSANSDHETKKGLIVAVGEGKIVDGKRESVSVRVGQVVLYSWGEQISVDGEKYILVSESQILAVIS